MQADPQALVRAPSFALQTLGLGLSTFSLLGKLLRILQSPFQMPPLDRPALPPLCSHRVSTHCSQQSAPIVPALRVHPSVLEKVGSTRDPDPPGSEYRPVSLGPAFCPALTFLLHFERLPWGQELALTPSPPSTGPGEAGVCWKEVASFRVCNSLVWVDGVGSCLRQHTPTGRSLSRPGL